MGKLLDAVRAKNPSITPEQVSFVTGVEASFDEVLSERLKTDREDLETRNSAAIAEAIRRTVGELPKNDKDEVTPIVEQIRSMAEQMDKLSSVSQKKIESMSRFQLRKMVNDNFDSIVRKMQTGSSDVTVVEFEAVRAAAMMTTQNTLTGAEITTGTIPEMSNEIALIKYPENFITEIIDSRFRSKLPATKAMRMQDTTEGGAALTAEGAVKPLISYKFTDVVVQREKYAAHIEWTEEFEMDKEALYNAIMSLFQTDVLRAWHNGVLAKIIAGASTYVSTTLDETLKSPNLYTAIGAGVLHVQNMLFQPDVLWMNPADVWGMTLTQDTTGQFVVPPATFGKDGIAGMNLYVSTKVEPGKFLLGQSDTWKEEHTGFTLRVGMINDQFIRNEKSIVGEIFSIQYQKPLSQGSWLYGDVAAINASLLTPVIEEP
jgi:hypothetical protein